MVRTSGRDGIHFEPGLGVTRQESVAFLHRYDENGAQPAVAASTVGLPAGTYVITAESSLGGGAPTFRLDEMVLIAEVHLTS